MLQNKFKFIIQRSIWFSFAIYAIGGPLAQELALPKPSSDKEALCSINDKEGKISTDTLTKSLLSNLNKKVSHTTKGAYETTLTPSPKGFAVAWYDTRNDKSDIYFTEITSDGENVYEEINISQGQGKSLEPQMVFTKKNFVLTWYEILPSGHAKVHLSFLDLNGKKLNDIILNEKISEHSQIPSGRNPLVLWSEKEIVVFWIERIHSKTTNQEEDWILGQVWSKDGKSSSPIRLVAKAHSTTWNLNGIFNDQGKIILTYHTPRVGKSTSNLKNEIHLLSMDAKLEKIKNTVLYPNTESSFNYPDIKFNGTIYGLTWHSEDAGKGNIYFTELSSELQPLRNSPIRITKQEGSAMGAYLWPWKDHFIIVWCDDSYEKGHMDLYVMTISNFPIKKKKRRLTQSQSWACIPSLASSGDHLGVSWNDMKDNSRPGDFHHSQVYFRLLD